MFPTSPTIGAIATMPSGQKFVYTSYGTWRAQGSGTTAMTYTAQSTAPTSPSVGDMWYQTTSKRLYLRTNDGGTAGDIWMDIST